MCVIIIKQKAGKLSQEVARTSSRINHHGLGIIWLDTFEVTYHKSADFKVLDTERPFIAHFRYATVGAINKQNTHPFQCGNNKNEYLMMNGTIHGLGNIKMSDSKVLANNLGAIPRNLWKAELEKHDCRFVTINIHSRTFQIYNREEWIQKDGIWYSKDNVLEDNLVAVYGTLKKGYSNYYSFLTSSKFVASGKTKDKYPLIISGLPYLIEDIGKGHNVDVDVFKVSNSKLKDLDRLEGHPNWYCRKQIDIVVGKKTLSCWIYFNIKETATNQVFHKSYVQAPRKWSYPTYGSSWDSIGHSYTPNKRKYPAYTPPAKQMTLPEHSFFRYDELLDDRDVAEFNIDNEKPICVDCYHDLDYDGFSHYHCTGCDGWFAGDEVIKFQP
jgi:gamma-glutamylaminecyclotransferase